MVRFHSNPIDGSVRCAHDGRMGAMLRGDTKVKHVIARAFRNGERRNDNGCGTNNGPITVIAQNFITIRAHRKHSERKRAAPSDPSTNNDNDNGNDDQYIYNVYICIYLCVHKGTTD